MLLRSLLVLLLGMLTGSCAVAQAPASFTVSGDWDVRVALPGTSSQLVHVIAPAMVSLSAEEYAAVPAFEPKAAGWVKGVQLNGVKAKNPQV